MRAAERREPDRMDFEVIQTREKAVMGQLHWPMTAR